MADRLATAERAVEVAIGRRTTLAAALAERGVDVTATDIVTRPVPASVRFVRDDVTDPTLPVYRGADVVYALNLPPELHRPTRRVARQVSAPLLFTTLGTDPPAVPVDRETLPGETLYAARPESP